jgi:hypothetical protein
MDAKENEASIPELEGVPGQPCWRSCLDRLLHSTDTVTFRVLFVLIVLVHDRRKIVHSM